MNATIRYYLSLGSNVERRKQLTVAVRVMRASFQTLKLSPVYQSPAFGFDGPDFYNMVVCFDSVFSPISLKKWCRDIEMRLGRTTDQSRFSNRLIDIDLLLAGDIICAEKSLKLPRSEMVKRAYVLKPLVDLSPDLKHPQLQLSLESLWHRLPRTEQETVQVVDSQNWFI